MTRQAITAWRAREVILLNLDHVVTHLRSDPDLEYPPLRILRFQAESGARDGPPCACVYLSNLYASFFRAWRGICSTVNSRSWFHVAQSPTTVPIPHHNYFEDRMNLF